jgi:hypothetical protein
MLSYGFPWPRVPTHSAKISSWFEPLLHLMDHITSCAFLHTAEQDSQPTTSLIGKQSVPYQTCGSTCCSGVYTPKTRSLADSSLTNHITQQNPSVSTIPTHAQTTVSILTTVTSYHDGWKTNTLNTNPSQTQHHKCGNTCMPFMTAWLSIANQVCTQILKYET